jgi:hypothetical protein
MILPFMILNGEQRHITENYVSIPPALVITDEAGNIWTLGFKFGPISGGEYTFNVLCNGTDTGKFANRIERRKNEIWIFTLTGWELMKVMERRSTFIYAIGAKANKTTINVIPIKIKVYFNLRPDIPAVYLNFNSVTGGLEDLRTNPLICMPGQWLYAIVEPEGFDVTVAGYLGEKNVREIPIRKGVR